MELQLRPRFVLLIGVLIAASGCTTETPPLIPEDATIVAPDGSIQPRDGGTPPTCEAGLIDCEGTCTSVVGDSMNCGSCGNVCPSGVSCALGRCDCAAPMLGCDGLCVDPSSDLGNCGACGNTCGTGETCLDGTCTVECDEPDVRCSAPSEDDRPVYVCADVQTDPMNCGGCGTSCSGGATCTEGRCACPAGQVSCSGVCTDVSTDANNCGACLNSCGAGGVCMGGTCETCGTGLLACGSPARCADTMISRLHCGACDNTCGPGEGCNTGTCECLPGFTDCDGLCANFDGDPRNCGGCGIDCGRGGTCSAGVCACATGATICGAECFELDRDEANCGACGVACVTGEACYTGACRLINDSCAEALPVTGDVVITDEDTTNGGPRPAGTGCGGGSGAEALYYAVTIPVGQEVRVQTTPSGDIVLFEQASCGVTGCTASTDSFPEQLTLSNVFGTAEVTRIVGVRTWSSSETDTTYDIAFTYSTPVVADNALCTAATAVTADATITGEDTATGGPRPSGTNCDDGSGSKALYYAVTIPMGQEVVVQTTPAGDIVLFEQAACADTGCVASTDSFPERLVLSNTFGTAEVTRFVGVRTWSSSETDTTYDIAFTYTTPVVAPNALCATPTAITADATIAGEDTATGGPRPSGTNCGGGSGSKALYYAVTIPVGQEVAVQTAPSGDIVLFERAACADTDCVASTDSGPEQMTLSNVFGTAEVTRIVGVRAYGTPTTAPTYGIAFTYTTPVVADNASCTTATSLTAGTSITGEDTAVGGPRSTGTGCGFGSGSKALYYAIAIPAGQQAMVTTDAAGDIVLFEQVACGDTGCAQYSDTPESLTVMNLGTTDVTRIVGVRNYSSTSTSTTYDITLTYSTAVVAANAQCTTATPITANMTITGEDTAEGGPRSNGTGCGGGSSNRALYYAVTIPAGQQLAVTTAAAGDIVLFEQAACGDAGCSNSSDTPESLTLSNTAGTSAVTRIVGVRNYSGSSTSTTYDITFTYTP